MKDIDLVKLKELALSASSGCWHQETEHECPWNVVDENGIQVAIMQQRTTIRDNPKQTDRAANAAFIAGANPVVILALIEQLESAQRAEGAAKTRIAELERQWEFRSPTPDAYEAACKALGKHRQRADAAEAELKRRDDAVPDDRIIDDGCEQYIGGVQQSDRLNCVWPVGTKFYAAAPAAVLPPDAEHVASVLEMIGNFESEDIDGDYVDLRFEVDGVDTGSDASITEYAGRGALIIRELIAGVKWVEGE